MELIQYREATFNVLRTLSCERTRVADAANNYLHTHWDFTVEVNWQPTMVAYGLMADGLTPVAMGGTLPGRTDLALLSRLLQPRGRLTVTAGSSVILDTPALLKDSGTRMPCDVKGGPSVEMVGVPMMIGLRHWIVTLHFIADVRDQVNVVSNYQNAILSNLWVGTEDIDEEHRSVRRFAGRAILRADLMRVFPVNINANSFRDLYLFKCPDHYQRRNVHAQLSEDGTVLDWSFEDGMRGYDLGEKSPILHIECFVTGHAKAGTPGRVAIDTAHYGAQFATMAAVGDAISFGSSLLAAAGAAALLALKDNLPRCYMNCRCDIIGDRNANLGKLTSIALGVALSQVGLTVGFLASGVSEIIFRQDRADRVYTSAELTINWTDDNVVSGAWTGFGPSPIVTVLGNGGQQIINAFTADSRFLTVAGAYGADSGLQNQGIAADRSGGYYNSNPPLLQGAYPVVPAPAPTTVNGTPTGNFPVGVEQLIVQALLGQGVVPPQPTTLTMPS